ncbi:MAG: hypothetical protein A3J97_12630 [Spirochaetes bacterium RIFOXYC1_FULL_54_7]|nr:MAG: hypothetical protein A3J97_12630 [Spirochaetes bacterium RIFOXYC1_FULL_54_7]
MPGLILVVILFSTCPSPFKLSDLDILEDSQSPQLILDEPVEGALFQDSLTISGIALDLDAQGLVRPLEDRAAIPALGWSIPGEEESGTITVESDGSFTLSIPTDSYNGNISLVLTAMDLNRNQTSITRRLLYDSSGPVVTVDSPIDRTVIGKTVVVEGSVRNSDGSVPTNVAAVEYEVLNTIITGDLSEVFDPETGEYSFQFDSTNLSGNILIRITATDKQGDSTSIIRQLTSDLVGPAIRIASPADYSVFESGITVTGSVANSEDDTGLDEVVSLAYSTTYALQTTAVLFDAASGVFDFHCDTSGIKTDIVVTLIAIDIHGHASSRSLTLRNDGVGPHLTLTSPVDGYYATCIKLSGRVQNGPGDTGLGEVELASVSYRIPGTIIGGTLVVDEDAEGDNLWTQIDSSQLSTNVVLELTASDKNGNESLIRVNLLKPAGGGSININTEVQNSSITFTWDPVPEATSYRMEEFVFGGIRDNINLEEDGIYTWTGLTNGTFHEFQLSATVPGYETAVSADLVLAPMSPLTFRPWAVNSGYGRIEIEWYPSLTAGARYLLERQVNDGNWEALTVTTASTYSDTDVIKSNYYRYRLTLRNNGSSSLNQSVESTAFRPPYFSKQPVVANTVGSYTLNTIERHGELLIASDNINSLRFFDLDDPLSPISTGEYITSFGARFHKAGSYAYGFRSGYATVVVADLDTRTAVATFALPDWHINRSIYGMSSTGTILFVAAADDMREEPGAIYIYDINNPASPILLGSFASEPMGLYAQDNHLFIAHRFYDESTTNWKCRLMIADVSDPDSVLLTDTSLLHANNNMGPEHMVMSGDYLFMRDNEIGMRAYQVTNPAAPLEVANGGYVIYADGAMHIDGSTLYIADAYRGGYKAFNIASILDGSEDADGAENDTDPYLYTFELDGYTTDLYADNGVLWLAQLDSGGICILDIGMPSSIHEIGPVTLSGVAGDTNVIRADGDRMLVLSGSESEVLIDTLQVLDISTPENPVITATIQLPSSNRSWPDMGLIGDIVMLSSTDTIDIATSPPQVLSTGIIASGRAWKMRLQGDLAILGTNVNDGITMVDIATPTTPVQQGVFLEGGNIAVELAGTYVISARDGEVAVIDLGNRKEPALRSAITANAGIQDLALSDNTVFVLDGSEIRVFFLNPLTGSLTEQTGYNYSMGFGFDPHEILVQGDFILIRSGNGTDTRLTLLDASDISSISETASLTLSNLDTDCMEWSANIIYLGDNESRRIVACRIE